MKNFIGIDICEKSLDVFLHPLKTYKQFENTKQGIAKLCEYLKDFEIEQIAMEATGNLEVDCAKRLIESGYKVSVVNPAQVCYFRRSLGRKNKTDMVDAEIIAKFCEVMKPVLSSNASEEQEKLHYLSARRQQLITIKVAENNRLRRVKDEDCKKDIIQTIDILKKKIIKFEQLMLSIIKKNKELLRKYDILNSVPGVGKILALSLICNYSELGTLNQKQAASLGGVIPLNQMSGAMFGKKSMRHNGRKVVRSSLYMIILVAMRYNNLVHYHYTRLLANGKAKKVAMGACMRKLIIVLNSLIKEDRLWSENFAD